MLVPCRVGGSEALRCPGRGIGQSRHCPWLRKSSAVPGSGKAVAVGIQQGRQTIGQREDQPVVAARSSGGLARERPDEALEVSWRLRGDDVGVEGVAAPPVVMNRLVTAKRLAEIETQ